MNSNTRLIANTLAQNIRTVINIVLSLYSTRIAMQALGLSDYGIYMLVAGIVSLLSYICNTLIVTTQRYLSYSAGAGKTDEACRIFANSYLIHWVLGICCCLVFILLEPFIFNGHLLNIPEGKAVETEVVYYLVTTSVLLTFVTAPFRALLISHENIVYISLVDVIDGVLKLGLVFLLLLVEQWQLPLYALIIVTVMFFNLVMLAGYCHYHYEESSILPSVRLYSWKICRQLFGFAVWTLYGMACVYVRSQGVAVILNRMLGTLVNAAYGVAQQVQGAVQYLSQALGNAISPQIVKAEGEGNRALSIHLTLMASKYGFFLLSLASIPLISEMPVLLDLWLDEIPQHAVLLCRMMLIIALCDQITISLGSLNQAIGRIRNYTLLTFTVKVLCIPVIIVCLSLEGDVVSVMCVYMIFELLAAIIRVPFLMHTAGLKGKDFLCSVLLKLILPTFAMVAACWGVNYLLPPTIWRMFVTAFCSVLIGLAAIWFTAMDASERKYIYGLISKRWHYGQA